MSFSPSLFWAVVPAAGIGSRFVDNVCTDTSKQYRMIGDRTVLEHSVAVLLQNPCIHKVVIALHADDNRAYRLPALRHPKIRFIAGGAERADSVRNALLYLSQQSACDHDWVLVHDAARPCLHAEDLQALLSALAHDAVGGLLAVPATDTLKQADVVAPHESRVRATLDRSLIWHAYTPQMFRFSVLLQAMQQAHRNAISITDEASAIETLGLRPRLIQGRRDNIKITYSQDLALAAFYLAQQRQSLPQESP
jgi:2-C-methyl-D-erythritol 4-phosphate cytidylyltransferase